MRSLFNETKNPIFPVLCSLVNEIYNGAEYTEAELLQQLKERTGFQYNNAADIAAEQAILEKLFHFQNAKAPAELYLNAPLPHLPPENIELEWLRSLLDNPRAAFLLPTALHTKLSQQLRSIPPLIPPNIWQHQTDTKDNPAAEPLQTYLRITLQALRQRQQITIQSKHQIETTISPCRLEYDLANGEYTLLYWNETTAAPSRLILADLQKLNITEYPIPDEFEEKFDQFYQENQQTLRLRLQPKRNAVERCFALFSSFNKEAYWTNDNTYILKINYCHIDQSEIIAKLLSLGAAVTVLEPTALQKEIIKILRSAQKKYQDKTI